MAGKAEVVDEIDIERRWTSSMVAEWRYDG
jgi:hypothetical protein